MCNSCEHVAVESVIESMVSIHEGTNRGQIKMQIISEDGLALGMTIAIDDFNVEHEDIVTGRKRACQSIGTAGNSKKGHSVNNNNNYFILGLPLV